MVRYITLCVFLLGLGAMAISLSGGSQSEDTPAPPVAKSTEQANSNDTAKKPGETQEGEITDADRMIRLETSIETDKKQLAELETELQKARADEEIESGNVQQLATEIEDAKKLLQQTKLSGDGSEAEKQQTRLTELETKHKLASEQFNLAIQTRKTVQAQSATLQQKITEDQDSLDKLKGVASPVRSEAKPSTPSAPLTANPPDSALALQQGASPESTDTGKTEPEEVVVSKDLAKARAVVADKSNSLQDIEQDVDSLTKSKTLLEKSIELESAKLESTRQKYDSLENSLAAAEQEFNEKLAAGTPANELQQLRQQNSDIQQRMRDARGEIRNSTDRRQELRSQLLALQAEETQLVKKSDELRREMAAAKRSEWVLKIRDYLYVVVPQVVAILVLTFILWILVRILCGRSRSWIAHAGRGTPAERQNRADTLAGVFHNTGNVVIGIGSLLMILDAAGVPVTALLGGAGVVGLAVAFGAQSLIKDYFCGFILLLENQYKVNDVVTIGSLSGSVERITLRITVLRDFEGKVHFIPNGQISSVTNATMDWSRAVLEVGVAYKENIDHVIAALKQLASELREDPEYCDSILSDIEMLGVDNLADSSVVVKFGLKTRPDRKWPVKRELLRRIKNTFDERGIEIPFPHRTVIHRTEKISPANLVAPPVGDEAVGPLSSQTCSLQ